MAVPPRFPNFRQPTAEEFESMIVELDAMRRVHCDIDGLKEKLRLLMGGYSVLTPVCSPGLSLFRGRIVGRKPTSISELGAPPPGYVRTPQRCNRRGKRCFIVVPA